MPIILFKACSQNFNTDEKKQKKHFTNCYLQYITQHYILENNIIIRKHWIIQPGKDK